MSQADRDIVDSLKRLKTLRCIDGRVSVSPCEALGRPGCLEARAWAAESLHKRALDLTRRAKTAMRTSDSIVVMPN